MSKRIYTRAGDDGSTGLLSGERVSKDDAQVEAYGTVDELVSFLGLAKVHSSVRVAGYLNEIQSTLFSMSAELAASPKALEEDETLRSLRRIDAEDVKGLERIADELSEELPPLQNFVIPGRSEVSALLHVCRTVCRRAERRIVEVSKAMPVNPEVVKYINRLSDLLFVMSRYEDKSIGHEEPTISRGNVTGQEEE